MVRSNYVLKLRYKMSFFSYFCLEPKNDEKIRNYYVICLLGSNHRQDLKCGAKFYKKSISRMQIIESNQ